jgi:hypothetical protein
MKIKNRQQFLAILAVTGVALLLGDKVIVSPLTKSWKERSERIVELRKNIAKGTSLAQRDRIIRERWDHMHTNTLPKNVSDAETQVLRAFDRWSQESRIGITSLKPLWKQAAEDYWTLEYRCDAFGGAQSLTRFLYQVEHDPMAIKVESVEITSRDNNGEQLTLGLQVSGLMLNPQEQ